MAKLSAVLFDYGLVLTAPPDPAAWAEMKRVLAADETVFHAAYWKFRHEYDRGALTGEAYWRSVAAACGRALSEAELRELDAADTVLWTQPNAEMIAWVAQLQRAGMKTGILSNLGDAMELGVRSRCPWLSEFTHLTFSHRLRIAKPELAIYRHAAEGLQTPVEEVLFVDDREDNIAAARAAGMQAVQYVNHDEFVRSMREAGYEYLLKL